MLIGTIFYFIVENDSHASPLARVVNLYYKVDDHFPCVSTLPESDFLLKVQIDSQFFLHMVQVG